MTLTAAQRHAIDAAQAMLDELVIPKVNSRLIVADSADLVRVQPEPDGDLLWVPVYAEDETTERWRYVMAVFRVGVEIRDRTGVRLVLSPRRKSELSNRSNGMNGSPSHG